MTGTAATLDNLTLARKEGWQKFVNTPARVPPEAFNREELLLGAADADGVIGLLTDRIDAEFFDAAKKLKAIQRNWVLVPTGHFRRAAQTLTAHHGDIHP